LFTTEEINKIIRKSKVFKTIKPHRKTVKKKEKKNTEKTLLLKNIKIIKSRGNF
jgi:hypothetical protein